MLAIILIAVVGAAAVLGGAFKVGLDRGEANQLKIDQPKIVAAETDRDRARLANETLQRDLTTIRGEVATCNAVVAELKVDSDTAIATMNDIIKESEARKKSYAAILAKFNAAARPTTPVAPDLQCQAARAALGDLSDEMKAIDALGLTKPLDTLTVAPEGKVKSIIKRFSKPAEKPK